MNYAHTLTKLGLLSFFIFFLAASCARKDKEMPVSALNRVDPFIGTGGHGHTFPGPSAPFGMVQPSPDNGRGGWDWCSGYHYSDSLITGFANLHLSGTGIGDLADVLLMPTSTAVPVSLLGKTRDSLPYVSTFSHDQEEALPGYYKVHLQNPNIDVALTANTYVAHHKYNYHNATAPSFVVDLGYAVNWDRPLATYLFVESDTLIVGHRHSTGWAKNQKVFFAIKTNKPIISQQMIVDGKTAQGLKAVRGAKSGAQFFFDKTIGEVEVQLAYSSVSIANAKQNLQKHGGDNFETTKQKAANSWQNALDAIRVETPIDSLKTIFYTALYHAQLAPTRFSDVNGQFRLQNDSIAVAADAAYSTLSLWDTFRAENPLLNLLYPQTMGNVVASMLAYYKEQGTLPVWTLYGNETFTMTGNHGVSVIAEAFLKDIGGFDRDLAYQAAKNTMMGNGRGLDHYKTYGFIPYTAADESVTISLEFAYNDWCVAQMAKKLGKTEDYHYFLERSKAYQHLFDPETGFMRGKSADGLSWNQPFDPKHSNHREHTDYTEGNAWQHSWFVPHNVKDLIRLHGGKGPFVAKLEQLFTEDSNISGDNISADISGLIGQYAHGNEPSHHIAYMFNKAGQPWKTQYWVRQILDSQYSTQPDGLSGNEDCGQMSAWYVFSAMGIYPMNPAAGQYELGSPLFKKVALSLPNGKQFTIAAPNTSAKNIYVQGVKLNGQLLEKTYISHDDILNGGLLEFEMGPEPQKITPSNKTKL